LRLGRFDGKSGVTREAAQQRAQILAPAFAEEGEQRGKLLGRQGRGLGEPRIVAVLAR
jgi:hypothetical protein